MAVYRENPKCPKCGGTIYGVYKKQDNLPSYEKLIGDLFVRWDWEGHNCSINTNTKNMDLKVLETLILGVVSRELKNEIDVTRQVDLATEILRTFVYYQNDNIRKLKLEFRLRMNADSWGMYSKGDEDNIVIDLMDENCGLVRFPIDKRWDIVGCKINYDYP